MRLPRRSVVVNSEAVTFRPLRRAALYRPELRVHPPKSRVKCHPRLWARNPCHMQPEDRASFTRASARRSPNRLSLPFVDLVFSTDPR